MDPGALAARRDEGAGLPSRQAGHVAEFGDGPAALGGVAVLDPGVEEAHADVHEGGPVVGVQRRRVRDRLDAGADAPDRDGVARGRGGGHGGGDHGGGRHGWCDAVQDDAAAVEKAEHAGDAVGAVVDGGAEGGG